MCDFSLSSAKSRPAKVGDKLITHNFGTGTTGFRDVESETGKAVAVCLLPGTELAFAQSIEAYEHAMTNCTVAIFRQINKDKQHAHHDALELPQGNVILLTRLAQGQKATVLQLPKVPKTAAEAEQQKRLAYYGN